MESRPLGSEPRDLRVFADAGLARVLGATSPTRVAAQPGNIPGVRKPSAFWAFVSVIAVATSLAACKSAKPEAERLVSAVTRYRQTDDERKADMAQALADTPCTDADVCAAKQACVASAEPTARAIRLKRDVEQSIEQIERADALPEGAVADGLKAKLEEAKRLFDQGFQALPACDERVQGLKRRYGI